MVETVIDSIGLQQKAIFYANITMKYSSISPIFHGNIRVL